MFVDRVQIEVEAGGGGNGCSSFRRERYIPKGGPDGGDGGDGGSIIILAEEGVNSLVQLAHQHHWRGKRGGHGSGANRTGRKGEDMVIKVPPGTVVIDAKENFVLKDLAKDGDQLIAARGGKGGRGNLSFKSSTNRAPRECQPGDPGEKRLLTLELKSIADVGLIGKPNAGKSTLLSRLSRARPEIADYPFTTKFPNLGQVQIDIDTSFILADIPGLIEGAAEGVGLGHEFLRHVERAGLLVHLIEPAPVDGTDPMENYHSIRKELEAYNPKLAARPEVTCVTKAELPGAEEFRSTLQQELGRDVFLISAVTGQGLNEMVRQVAQQLEAAKNETEEA
ncbi:GTPase ObgE [Blastopirellula marina]|uniref:GTPase Obg n=1 Tax=Blastopirellula marina TaxID=124 RepID=A0A2S8FXS6_9BACT|nr:MULTISPECIES: GTPase ObgE [Pirellulaceae]PQO36979.1 GTPase ObgE [Blastopirellula marina]RCS53694.1 GTPase ObgE [Bremerella cremea]